MALRGVYHRLKNSSWLRYAIALVCVLGAALITLRLFPVLYPNIFTVFFVAVIISAWFGGFSPGAMTTALAVVIILYITPSGWTASPINVIRLGIFTLVSLLIS